LVDEIDPPMHSHPQGFVYALSDAKIKSSPPDGKSEETVLKTLPRDAERNVLTQMPLAH
jgi:hypothetical protein